MVMFTYAISCKGLCRQSYLLDSDIHLAKYRRHLFGWDTWDTGYIDCNHLLSSHCRTCTCAQIHQCLYKCHERMDYWNFWKLKIQFLFPVLHPKLSMLKIHFFLLEGYTRWHLLIFKVVRNILGLKFRLVPFYRFWIKNSVINYFRGHFYW